MKIKSGFETVIFASRWLLVAFYLALIVCLCALVAKGGLHVWHLAADILTATETQVTLDVLALVDLTLTASLVVIVILSGYENFVSRVDAEQGKGWPEWMTRIDFSGLKLKLVSTVVAIAAIHVLRLFLEQGGANLLWPMLALLVFGLTGVLLALGDWISGKH